MGKATAHTSKNPSLPMVIAVPRPGPPICAETWFISLIHSLTYYLFRHTHGHTDTHTHTHTHVLSITLSHARALSYLSQTHKHQHTLSPALSHLLSLSHSLTLPFFSLSPPISRRVRTSNKTLGLFKTAVSTGFSVLFISCFTQQY